MVFNVTKDDIKVRLAKVEQDIWPQPSTIPLVPPNPADNKTPMSNFIKSGRVVYQDVLEKLYGQINKLYDKNIPVPAEE
jgi:ribonuclease Z